MPKGRRNGRRGQNGLVVSGIAYFTGTVANGNTSVAYAMQPTAFSKLTKIQLGYEFYRFRSLSFDVAPITRFETSQPSDSTAGYGAMGYYSEITTATTTNLLPSSILTMAGAKPLAASVVNANTHAGVVNQNLLITGKTVNVRMNVPKSSMRNTPVKMYRTNATATSEDAETVQGTLFFAFADAAGTNTITIPTRVFFVCEFFNPVQSDSITVPSCISAPKTLDSMFKVKLSSPATRAPPRSVCEEKVAVPKVSVIDESLETESVSVEVHSLDGDEPETVRLDLPLPALKEYRALQARLAALQLSVGKGSL